MHPRVFDVFACTCHIPFPRPMTTHKPFIGAPSTGFLADSHPLGKEKTHILYASVRKLYQKYTKNAPPRLETGDLRPGIRDTFFYALVSMLQSPNVAHWTAYPAGLTGSIVPSVFNADDLY